MTGSQITNFVYLLKTDTNSRHSRRLPGRQLLGLPGAQLRHGQRRQDAVTIGPTNYPPAIVTQPASLTVTQGLSATFSVVAGGDVPLGYQWVFNQTNIAGATASSYTNSSAQLANAGPYSVVVSNDAGTATSALAFLSVLGPLTNTTGCVTPPSGLVTWWPGDGNTKDIAGTNNATPQPGFSYVAGEVSLAFHFDGVSGYLPTGAASLAVPWTACFWVNRQNAPGVGAALVSDGSYELKLEQYDLTRQVGVSVFGVGDYTFNYIAPAGTWVHLAFVGTSSGTSLYTNGVLQGTMSTSIPLPRAYIGVGYVTSGGRYVDFLLAGLDEIMMFNRALSSTEISSIYAAGSAGLCKGGASYHVVTPPGLPQITSQPCSLAAVPGGAATFAVSASGAMPLYYQWYKGFANGVALKGATTATLNVANVQPADFANYTVLVSNSYGSVASAPASLSLAVSPAIRSPGLNGGAFSLSFPTEVGPAYRVEYKDSLEDPSWQLLTILSGTGSPLTITDNAPTNAARFYRIRLQ